MRILSAALTILLPALHASAIPRFTLTTSSTYTLGLSGSALAHASPSAQAITADPIDSAAKNQVWSVRVTRGADDAETATVQNVGTLAFMAPGADGASVVAAQSAFSWDLVVGAHNLFCHGVDGPCISVGSSGAVMLVPQNFNDPIQQMDVSPVPPPAGAYALLNEAHRVILAGGTPLPASATFVPFPPANLENSIWIVEPVPDSPTQLVLTNRDTAAPLRADGARVSVTFPQFAWSSGFGQDVGTFLSAPGGLLSGEGTAPSLNDTHFPDVNVGWVFLPVL
ncbi:hypothetical protein AURDEDRAFT_153244 [Auricularia subglabra TFB-10046 SS5]|uniref:Uncharacterized protein n=1 Tax=Auricularia subglabra (strain TFB-10046 / SS5) TaxID=717982 RepID=J0WYN4_AURST|nr:hypothetical protein AURDEDRAFT_153244 [Auricularia subglabra TFB-10046 SS5]